MYFDLICVWPARHLLRWQEIVGLPGKVFDVKAVVIG